MRRVVCWALSVAMTLGLYAGPASVAFANLAETEDEVHEVIVEPSEDQPSDYEAVTSDEGLQENPAATEEDPARIDGGAEIEQDDSSVGESTIDETLADDATAEEVVAVEGSPEGGSSSRDNPFSAVRNSDSIPLTAMAQDTSTAMGLKMPAYSIDAKVREGFSGEDRFAFITEDNVLYTSFSFVGGEEDEDNGLTSMPNVEKFASARVETGVITTDGDLYVWVHPSEWSSTDAYLPRDAPMQQVMPGTKFTQYVTSNGQSFAIDSEGNLWGWGYNEYGELGNGGTQDVDVSDPVRILPGVRFSDVASCGGNGPTEEHCALTTSGKVYAWGQCYEPSILTEGNGVRYTPTEVPIPATIVDVEVGITHYGALDSSGGLWMWGQGGNGQLGILQDEDGERPGEPYVILEVPALTMTNVAQFSLGDHFSSAVTTDGAAYGWGWNQNTQSVFESDADNIHVPTKTLDNVVQVSCGTGVTFAVKKNGSLWRWGDEFWYDEKPPHLLVGSDDSAVHVSGEVDATLYTTLDKSNKHEITHTIEWDDDWMLGDSTVYNSKLSIASMVLAWAAYDDTPANGYRYITKTLKALGMGDIYTSSYTNRIHNEDSGYSQSIDRVAYSFSHRKTIDGEGNGIDLVFVVVRGTPGNIEWNSNANVADGSNEGIDSMFHEGFKAAEQEILRNLAVYFNKYEIDDETARILITGHSRGAAVANLLAADLQNQTSTEYTQDVTKDQVFAYTFATPAATTDAQAHTDAYANIFNIVNPEDFVPRVPLKAWGFERYGTTYYLPSKSTESAKFYDNIDDLQDTYYDLCGLSYHPYTSGAGATNNMVQDSESVARSVNEFYANSVPKSLISALKDDQFRRWQTFRDFFGNLTTFLGTGQILPVLEDGVSSTLYGRYGNIFSFFVYNSKITDCIAHAHTKETYLGWLEVLDEAGVPLLPYGGSNDTGKLTTYCPVALRVLDGNGNWAGSISSTGQVSAFGESPVALMYDEATDGKTVWLPTWGGYTVEITPYDSGSMDVTWSVCDAEGEEVQTVCFNDVSLEPMEAYEFSAELTDEEQPIIESATLIGPDEQEVDPTYVVDAVDDGKQVDITVSTSGNGTVTGPASSFMGEHVFVSAVPDEGYAFRGWYESGKLVEDAEATYAFRAEGDRNLEARFSLIQAEGIDMRTKLELSVGDEVNLLADVVPWEAADFPITYTSSNERVATVDAEGNVTAIAGGTATITARTPRVLGGSDYVEETCSVKVTGDSGQVNPFRDVSEKTPHYEDILWLADSGISTGWNEKDGTKTFRPTNTVIRQDMAAFLFRLAKLWGLVDDSWQPTGSVTFTDVNESTPHYREIMWLAESGISAGWKKGDAREFRPTNTVIRQDMAAFLRRLQALRDPSVRDWKPTGDSPFRDVTSSTPHSEDILWLAESGVSAGWKVGGTKEFRPTNTVIRQDMAAFLHRLDALG